MIGFKLTDQDMRTYGDYQWQIGETKQTDGRGGLCGPGWLHYYEDPLLAVLHNPVHAGMTNPRLFRCEVGGQSRRDGYMKAGCSRLTLVEEIELPTVTTEQRIAYGILCALSVCKDKRWRSWANDWLSGEDRSEEAAAAAAAAAAEATAWTEAAAAAWTAARTAATAWTTTAAAWAAATAAARTAAAAAAAETTDGELDLISLARKAMEY